MSRFGGVSLSSQVPPRILVVTPTLGRSGWIEETCASVDAQRWSCRHVLVAPADKLAELAARFPRCLVTAEPAGERGMYAAINAGIAAADEDWSAFTYLNDDDVLLPLVSACARSVAVAGRGRPLIVYGAVRLIDGKGRRVGAIPVSPQPALNRELYAERLEPVYQHGTLVTREAWARLGGFDATLRYCGDSEFFARACLKGVPFERVNGEVAAFRLRVGQLTKHRAAMLAERAGVDEKLKLLAVPRGWRRRWARALFRMANAPAYVERVARHGFATFDELVTRLG